MKWTINLLFLLVSITTWAHTVTGVHMPNDCPGGLGLIPVLGNSDLKTEDFCVFRYEARNRRGTPVAITPKGTPWTRIDAYDAQKACESLNNKLDLPGYFSLISNPEWMTIARDIESVASNWSGGEVGKGMLGRGHLGGSSRWALRTDAKVRVKNKKRTHTLSNGFAIWDFSGNAAEWVDWNAEIADFTLGPKDGHSGWSTLDNLFDSSVSAKDLQPFRNYVQTKKNNYLGLGLWRGGNGGAAIRGGSWANTRSGGVFSLDLHDLPTLKAQYVGFRCVYRP